MKSYTFGMLQTNAFKALKSHTATLLKKYDITTYEWALLGILFESKNGYRTTELANKMSVSKPFITKTVRSLTEKRWVEVSASDKTDLRATHIVLTKSAQKQIPEIEAYLKAEMRQVLSGISKLQLYAYIKVLQHITKKLDHEIDTKTFTIK